MPIEAVDRRGKTLPNGTTVKEKASLGGDAQLRVADMLPKILQAKKVSQGEDA